MRVIRAKPSPAIWTLKEFHARRNWTLIKRDTGGLGDILMSRMIIEDIKILHPDLKVAYACPEIYMPAVQDHPLIDAVLDFKSVDIDTYVQKFDITSICGVTETMKAPLSAPHRSDIWANWCGLELTRHNMHLRFTDAEKDEARQQLAKYRTGNGPAVVICPNSAIVSKNMSPSQFNPVVTWLRDRGCFVYGLHSTPILEFDGPKLCGRNMRNFMALVAAADYAVTVDSAAFHIAGGLGLPQVAMFTWADGKVYGKYYQNWELVQRHRDDGNWNCGPCYRWGECPKVSHREARKPCATEITAEEIIEALERVMAKYPVEVRI